MDELKDKQVFIVVQAMYLGLPTEGLTILPAIVHQQHGNNVHCFIKNTNSNSPIIVTVSQETIYHNIKDAMEIVNTSLLKTTNNAVDTGTNRS